MPLSNSLTVSLLPGLAERLTCVQGDVCSAASLKVALFSGEEKGGLGGGLEEEEEEFLGGDKSVEGGFTQTRGCEEARGSRLVMYH